MERPITDEDIRGFIRKNRMNYPSQISLMQAAIRLLWPGGPPTLGNERVVSVCLEENQNHPVVS